LLRCSVFLSDDNLCFKLLSEFQASKVKTKGCNSQFSQNLLHESEYHLFKVNTDLIYCSCNMQCHLTIMIHLAASVAPHSRSTLIKTTKFIAFYDFTLLTKSPTHSQ